MAISLRAGHVVFHVEHRSDSRPPTQPSGSRRLGSLAPRAQIGRAVVSQDAGLLRVADAGHVNESGIDYSAASKLSRSTGRDRDLLASTTGRFPAT